MTCTDYEATAKAIEDMVIQGAIGVAVAAGLGYVQAAYAARDLTVEERHEYLEKAAERLRNTRPTGQRLWVLLHELEEITDKHCASADLEDKLLEHVREYLAYFDHVSRETGRHAASLLDDGDTILPTAMQPVLFYGCSILPGSRQEDLFTLVRPGHISRVPN